MDQTKKPQVLRRRAVLILMALAAVAFAGYNLLGLLAFSAIAPVEPESIYFPAVVACIGMGLAWWSVSLRGGPAILRTGSFALAIVSTALCAFSLWQAGLVLAEPLYRQNRLLTLNVWWQGHPQLANRIVFQFQPGGIWLTLQEQRGLQEHLRALDDSQTVELEVTALLTANGDVSRFRVHRLAGFQLEPQDFPGNYLQAYIKGAKERAAHRGDGADSALPAGFALRVIAER
jgi:hypothetical protein